MSRQQFSLRWNNYLRHVTNAFDSLRSQEDLVDVTLSCEGKKIKAHKMLLSACSSYFKDIFKENPCQHPVIIFRNVRYDDLWAIINFMYHGEVNILQEQLASFLTTAELLEVQGLTDGTDEKDNEGNNELEVIRNQVASEEFVASDPPFHAKKRKLSFKKHVELDSDITAEVPEIDIISINTVASGNNLKLESIEHLDDTNIGTLGSNAPSTSVVTFPEAIEICDSEVFENPNLLHELKPSDGNNTNSDATQDIMVAESALKDSTQDGDLVKFRCHVCWKGFKHPTSLTLHKDSHTGKTQCPVCHRSFSRSYDMRSHLMKIHQDQPPVDVRPKVSKPSLGNNA